MTPTRPARIDPPVSIMTVLNAALAALSTDTRFATIHNGDIEIAWCQPKRSKEPHEAKGPRYRLTVELAFRPDMAPAPGTAP